MEQQNSLKRFKNSMHEGEVFSFSFWVLCDVLIVHYFKQTWNPINNKKFEVLSYLPPLSDDSIAKEIDYMLKKGWIPCLEFDEVNSQFIQVCECVYRYIFYVWDRKKVLRSIKS